MDLVKYNPFDAVEKVLLGSNGVLISTSCDVSRLRMVRQIRRVDHRPQNLRGYNQDRSFWVDRNITSYDTNVSFAKLFAKLTELLVAQRLNWRSVDTPLTLLH